MIASTALLLATLVSAVPLQQPFGRPEAIAPKGFTRVSGVSELPDGRIVVVDGDERRIALVDLTARTETPIARAGSGPNEYRSPFGPVRLPGDTLAVYDVVNRRLLLLDRAGRPAGTVPLPDALFAGRGVSVPRGGDRDGFLYFETTVSQVPPPVRGAILRWQVGAAGVDSVGDLLVRDPARRRILRPFLPRDGWAVTWDGRVALVENEPYRLRWFGARAGRPVAIDRLPLGQGEMDAYWDGPGRRGASGTFSGGGGGSSASQARRRAWEYPDRLPAFDPTGIVAAPNGDVWVSRSHRWNDRAVTVDVFGPDGERRRTLTLPPSRRLVAFGTRSVYLVRVDDDDLQWLERYPYPHPR